MSGCPNNKDLLLTRQVSELLLQEYKYIKAVYLFGSRARGTAKINSDYDILVSIDDTVERGKIILITALMQEFIYNVGFPESIELLVLREEDLKNGKNNVLYKNLIKEGVLLNERVN